VGADSTEALLDDLMLNRCSESSLSLSAAEDREEPAGDADVRQRLQPPQLDGCSPFTNMRSLRRSCPSAQPVVATPVVNTGPTTGQAPHSHNAIPPSMVRLEPVM
jgi:hypothetical protein